jgi:hypothetical protein
VPPRIKTLPLIDPNVVAVFAIFLNRGSPSNNDLVFCFVNANASGVPKLLNCNKFITKF